MVGWWDGRMEQGGVVVLSIKVGLDLDDVGTVYVLYIITVYHDRNANTLTILFS